MTRPLRIRTGRAAALAALLVSALAGEVAWAESLAPGSGRLKSVSSGAAVAPGTAIALIPGADDFVSGDDPFYRAAREELRAALAGRGHAVAEGAPLVLRVQIDLPNFGRRPPDDEYAGTLVSIEATAPPGPARKARVTNHVELPFEPEGGHVHPGLAVSLLLFDRAGRPLWSSTVQAAGATGAAEDTVRRLLRAAMATLGADSERSFVLACEGASGAPGLCLP
jgi:hypothetical protein